MRSRRFWSQGHTLTQAQAGEAAALSNARAGLPAGTTLDDPTISSVYSAVLGASSTAATPPTSTAQATAKKLLFWNE